MKGGKAKDRDFDRRYEDAEEYDADRGPGGKGKGRGGKGKGRQK